MFIAWGWLLFAIFAVVITCFGLYLAGGINAFNSPRISRLFNRLEECEDRLEVRERELSAAIIERDKLDSELENMKRNFRDMEAERAHLRQMILDAKNVLMES